MKITDLTAKPFPTKGNMFIIFTKTVCYLKAQAKCQ